MRALEEVWDTTPALDPCRGVRRGPSKFDMQKHTETAIPCALLAVCGWEREGCVSNTPRYRGRPLLLTPPTRPLRLQGYSPTATAGGRSQEGKYNDFTILRCYHYLNRAPHKSRLRC